ncbi:7827_t:CDS:2 [Paraglomus brasilianum]|uniref:7827_t:CDS:1 n=1 Tax=Paraglomus brasilianum TaxID=144538 RepID=A0A9N9F634_9GLOM|nr:7827_t:CDS:2 [Paraglomus brasilianum]
MSVSKTELDAYLVENWDTETLVLCLQEQDLKLNEKHFDIIRNEEINGLSFLDMTEEKFRHGRVGYAVKKILDTIVEEIICITEGKQNQAGIGIAQNLMQCESSEQMNRRKRKVDGAFGDSYYDYLCGIVSIDDDTDLRKGLKG